MKRALWLTACAAAALLLVACSKKAPSSLDPKGPAAKHIAGVWWLMFGLAAAVYVVVSGFIVAAAMRGRRGSGEGKPSRVRDDTFIWFGGVIVPVLILAILAVVTVRTTNFLRRPNAGALKVEVVGYDWWWEVRYPGTSVVSANEVHVPAGRPVEVTLRTRDVIHSFWVPELAGKVDMIPGQRNLIRFTAERPGVYRGQCAEFCGLQHANMVFYVVADPAADFDRWMTRQQARGAEPVNEMAARGQVAFNRLPCAGCHTIRNTEARGQKGPDLTDFGGRRTIGAGAVPNTRGNLAGWIANAQALKPGNLMPPIAMNSDEALAIVEYLESLR